MFMQPRHQGQSFSPQCYSLDTTLILTILSLPKQINLLNYIMFQGVSNLGVRLIKPYILEII